MMNYWLKIVKMVGQQPWKQAIEGDTQGRMDEGLQCSLTRHIRSGKDPLACKRTK